jgi:DNA-binding Lrp family transcriptional regulator
MPQFDDLDRIDFEILALLQNDAQLSNKELSARVCLAPSTCLLRVRRLQKRGALLGFHARVAPEVLGIGMEAMIALQLERSARTVFDALWQHLRAQPEVVALFHVAGEDDVLVHVAVRDTAHLRDFVEEALTTRDEIRRMVTSIVFHQERRPALPSYRVDPLGSPGGGGGATRRASRAARGGKSRATRPRP